jgi:hypothetical protein
VHELAEVVSGQVAGRGSEGDVVLFKSVGSAAEDIAVGALVYERARVSNQKTCPIGDLLARDEDQFLELIRQKDTVENRGPEEQKS